MTFDRLNGEGLEIAEVARPLDFLCAIWPWGNERIENNEGIDYLSGHKGARMPVTRRRTDRGLSDSLKHAADAGPVVMPGYTVLKHDDWTRLLELIEEATDERDFKIAWDRRRRGEPEGATLDEMREKYGL